MHYGIAALVSLPGASDELCDNCAFLKWGAWVALANFQNDGEMPRPVTVLGHGYWVAGDIVKDSVGSLPTMGNAVYRGTALGTVSTNLNSGQWQTHDATGDLWMRWNFRHRSGDFRITDFDKFDDDSGIGTFHGGLDFGGKMYMSRNPTKGPNQFNGAIYGHKYNYEWFGGYAASSLVRAPGQLAGEKPDGVIGNWAIRNGNYNAGGIFAGSRTVPGAWVTSVRPRDGALPRVIAPAPCNPTSAHPDRVSVAQSPYPP